MTWQLVSPGEVPEWSNGLAWKACVPRKRYRGFESLPLRNCITILPSVPRKGTDGFFQRNPCGGIPPSPQLYYYSTQCTSKEYRWVLPKESLRGNPSLSAFVLLFYPVCLERVPMGSSKGIPAGESLPLRISSTILSGVPRKNTDGFFRRNPGRR